LSSFVGETPNLAALLAAALAEPDAVIIAASTRRLIGDRLIMLGNH
jgi:class 3 adenylate cyclase